MRPEWPTFEASDSDLDKLVKLSRYYGGDPAFVLAGGGNTSMKTPDRLFVKASGHALATIGADGFVEMHRAALHDLLGRDLGDDVDVREARFKEAVLAARVDPARAQRPSVEVVLHNLMPGRFVVHSHATLANMVTCCQAGERICRELFGDEVLWVPFVDPGFVLAKTLAAGMKDHADRTGGRQPEAILMANHGLIVAGDDPQEIRRRTDAVMDKLREHAAGLDEAEAFGPVRRLDNQRARRLIEIIGPALRGLLADGHRLKVVTFDDSPTAMGLAGAAEGQEIAAGGPLAPDQIVYCKSFPLWFDAGGDSEPGPIVDRLGRAAREHTSRRGFPPLVVLVRGLGLFAAGDDFGSADTTRCVYTDAIRVMGGARRLGGVQYMTQRDREFIEHWEVESYRRKVAAGERAAGRAAGKVAVVTGAAQGFGLQIAHDLVREGAHVALTDINAEGARTAAAELCERHGRGRAVGLDIDVTDPDAVARAIHHVVRAYGGFDLLVSNAGVLLADSVKTQPVRDFELVTNVNYKGYFLCVQAAAPVLAVQHLARPEYFSDIIQINSKSGLAGSNRNFAYAGSKFGGIGLTQSFALELIADGVKVNSICPGNFFDGPLWSDPDNGLFVQYLRTGKVPGAKTIDDVRKAYEAKVPMGRGCTTADVMKAIYYLIDQKYETGQALPVTGGQVMLR